MRTIATWAGKGGVSKTTMAINLCAAAHSMKLRAILIDQDRQGSALAYAGNVGYDIVSNSDFNPDDYDFCCVDYPAGYTGAVPPGVDIIVVPLGCDRLSYEGVEPYMSQIESRRKELVVTMVDYRDQEQREDAKQLANMTGSKFEFRFAKVMRTANNGKTSIFDESLDKKYLVKLHRSMYVNFVKHLMKG